MKQVQVDMLSEAINCPVLLVPGRKFPGVVVQGDSLRILCDLADDLDQLSALHSGAEVHETALALKRKLSGYLQEYEAVMKAHGRELPYVKQGAK
jgi:hypothetical protein